MGKPLSQLDLILFLLLAHQWTLLRTARDLADIYSLWRQYSPREQSSPLLAVPFLPSMRTQALRGHAHVCPATR
jgi:hypothetical protein